MSLEAIQKYFFPKSVMLSDSPRATASDALTGTDWMTAMGLANLKSGYGLDLFLAKMGISSAEKALQRLFEFALSQSGQYRAFAGLEEDSKRQVLRIIVAFAYQDYSRSAASVRTCECCKGKKLIEAEVFTTKSTMLRRPEGVRAMTPTRTLERQREVKEVVRIICSSCKGKGVISNACRCHGKGKVLDKAESERQGIPVRKDCPKCQGRGYARLPAENVRRAICAEVMELSEPTWRRNFKPFYEFLISQCHKEEAEAEKMLSKVMD